MINNTHNYLKHYLRFLVLCVLACWKTQVAFSQSYELFVGETYTLPEPTPPAGYVDHTGTGRCTNKSDCISVSGLQIKVRKYFTGTATIEVDYNYTWTYNGKRQVSNATAYYSVSCKPTEVKLNKTSIELGIGGEFDLSYTTTPSNLEPEVEWRTSDKKIASLDYSNETVADQKEVVVYGESEGTCTIRLVCNTGYPAPECKVTVVDNYWVKADVKGNVKKGTKVTLTSIKAGAVIYYTTDGTEPTKSSTRYTSPIQINEDLTIKAKAFLGNQESKTSTFNYTVVSHLDGEQFMAKTKEGVDMSFIAKSGALEVSSGSKYKPAIDKDYSGFITIPNKVDDMRVKYISERAFYGCNITGVAFEEITSVSVKVIQAEAFRDCKNLKSVTFPHGIGLREMSFYNCESLETIAFEGWAQYYYKDTKEIFNNCNKIKDIFLYRIKTIDAIRDDCFSNQTYDEATLHVPEKLISNYKLLSGWKKFKNIVAIESEQNEKLLLSASPSGGEVPVGTKVTLTAKANGSTVSADIYYTTNGTTPTKNSTKYSSSGITINEACTLKAIAYKDGYETSDVLTETYTTKSNPKLTLSASPSGGSVKSGTIVYLTTSADGSTVSGADIYYTLNGTTPTKNSTKYTSSGITISSACTLKAIAYKDGYETSNVLTEAYTIKSNPKLTLSANPSGGEVASGTKVTLTAKANGSTVSADIYYTLNGTTPTKNSTKYTSSGITISSACTLKAIAYKDGYETSDVLTGTYTIDNIKVTSITITGNLSTAMTVGGTRQLSASVYPSNATKKSVSWSSNKTNVATVNSSGLVTAEGEGTATITCKANDGSGVTATCTITVMAEELKDGDTFLMDSEEGVILKFEVISAGKKTCKLTWNTENKSEVNKVTIPATAKKLSVIRIDNATFQISYYRVKKVVIPNTVKEIGSEAFSMCQNLVDITIPNSVNIIEEWAFAFCTSLPSISIPGSVTQIERSAFNGCTSLKTVTSYISKPFAIRDDVFSDIPSDAILYVPAGTKPMYEQTTGWKKFKNIKVIGESDDVKVTDISIIPSSSALNVGETLQLAATITPSNATDKSVTWSTNNSSVASVNASGLVTANSAGTATITCKANDGSGVSASCSITIEDPTSGIEINANNYPDANFRNWLLEQDFGKDGRLTKAEISNIYTIDIANKNINNLKGIEIFTNLSWLNCEDNQLKSFDISKNLSLTSLSCGNNQLTSLDVSKNTRLSDLSCSNNKLTTLDVSKNTAISNLYCGSNQLTSLDLTKNTKLDALDCSNNKLTTLDVSASDLDKLNCSRNQIKGTGMDALIESLPLKGSGASGFYLDIFDNTKGDEGNVCTKTQVASIKNKGWTPRYYHKGITIQLWKEYEGSDEDPSDINTLLMDKNADNPIYNLSGQRLIAPKKGINIIGGKKVVVK